MSILLPPGFLHPGYLKRAEDWFKWRTCYEGGETFREHYLQMFSARENNDQFLVRKSLTPIPAFAKSAIRDIRNSLFQRMANISRTGGSAAYQHAVHGEGRGVDNRGSSMTGFIGRQVIDELLVLGKVGIWIDAPAKAGTTLLQAASHTPYLYVYKVEQIKNYVQNDPENPSEFQSLVLEELIEAHDEEHGMPCGYRKRLRKVWINEKTKLVNVQFVYPDEGEGRTPAVEPIVELKLTKIPFVLLDIGDSMIKDICDHQIALLNLWSSNVNYATQSGFPIYTEQRDGRSHGAHLKNAANDQGTATSGGQGANTETIEVGVGRGRAYDMNADRPDFIHPSPEPLLANLQLCDQLKKDIREVVNLAVQNLGTQASAESKGMDNSGLEAGLSFIGLVLETAEREIARHWATYESGQAKAKPATISYPERWSLKSDEQRIKDATDLHAVVGELPSRTAKRETSKLLIDALIGTKINGEKMAKIFDEIDKSNFTTSNPDVIQMAKEQGMLGSKTGAVALGFDPEEADLAAKEHVDRLAEIAKHQTSGVQGVADTQADPKANKQIQKSSRDPSEKKRGKSILSKTNPAKE